MLKQFMLDMKLWKRDNWIYLLVLLGSWLLGVGLVFLLMTDETVEDWACMGSSFVLAVAIMFGLLLGVGYGQRLRIALSMGRTRREFNFAYALHLLLVQVVGYGMCMALSPLERMIYSAAFPLYPEEELLSFLTSLWVLPGILLLTLVYLFIGVTICRFGKKVGAVYYFAWMAMCFGVPKLIRGAVWLKMVPVGGWIALAVAAVAAMLVTVVHLAKKQAI